MTKCPACQAAVGPQDASCPACGISLHHEAGSSSAGRGASQTLLLALVVALVGGVLLITCSGVLFFRYWLRPAMMMSTGTPAAGSVILYGDPASVDEPAEEPQQPAESGEE